MSVSYGEFLERVETIESVFKSVGFKRTQHYEWESVEEDGKFLYKYLRNSDKKFDTITSVLLPCFFGEHIWYPDKELFAYEGEEAYIKVLNGLAAISQGVFSPENITEHWDSETGPIYVRFTHNGTQVTVQPRYFSGNLDLKILRRLDPLVKHSKKTFELVDGGASIAVLFVTQQQRNHIGSKGLIKFLG